MRRNPFARALDALQQRPAIHLAVGEALGGGNKGDLAEAVELLRAPLRADNPSAFARAAAVNANSIKLERLQSQESSTVTARTGRRRAWRHLRARPGFEASMRQVGAWHLKRSARARSLQLGERT